MTLENVSFFSANLIADQFACGVLNKNMVVFSQQLPKILWVIVGMTFFMFLIYAYLLWKYVELKKEYNKVKEVITNGRQ